MNNEVDDNEIGNEEINDNNKETALLQEKLMKANIWNYIDKIIQKCLNYAKVFKSKIGISSIHIHLKSHGLLFKKEKQITLNNYVKRYSQKV